MNNNITDNKNTPDEKTKKVKTFIAQIPEQPVGMLKSIKYPSDNTKLVYDKEISFPILAAVNGYVEKGEHIKFIFIRNEANEATLYNYNSIIKPQLEELLREKGINYNDVEYKEICTSNALDIDSNIKLFIDIISAIDNNEILHACITYGMKPMPIVLLMSLNYAYRIKENVYIESIIYGKLFPGGPEIIDVTALFYANSLVAIFAEKGIKDIDDLLKKMLLYAIAEDDKDDKDDKGGGEDVEK